MKCYKRWWLQLPFFIVEDTWKPSTKISVIIAARNEEKNIAACIHSICKQNYPAQLFEIIVIDDNSTDNTFKEVTSIVYEGINITCITLEKINNNIAPKKRAIEKGIALASGVLIVTTDADCIMGNGWLKNIAACYQKSNKVFIAAPVKMNTTNAVLSKFQALDFLTMQGITAGAVFKGFHNMCNGANVAYEKKVFTALNGFAGINSIASGDDMLLMHKIAIAYPKQITFIKSTDAIVTTTTAESWKAFFQQRIRWASKATHYNQSTIFFVLLLVYLTNLSIASILIISFFYPMAFFLFLLLCFLKFISEVFFVKKVASFFEQQNLLPWLLLLQPLHIFYIIISGFLGQVKTYEWKGRKLK